jgi:hypothetical protein
MNVQAEAHLLRACLRRAAGWSEEPLDFRAADPERLLDVLDEQRLAPWLARRVDRLPGLPADMRGELEALYYREARDAGARWLELRDLRAALRHAPPCVLLKGGALLAGFYEELAERPMWDVDLLVDDEPAARAVAEALAAAGFAAVRAERTHHHLPALRRPGGELAVEIHLDLHTPSPGTAFTAAVRASARPAPAGWSPFHMPSRAALAAHHALHLFSDMVDSPLLRNVFELAQLVRAFTDEDARALRTLAGLTPYGSTVARALALAHRWFGAPAVLESPTRGWPEALADWRTGHLGHATRGERLIRHLVREAGEKLKRGWSAQSPLLPLAVGAEALGRAASARWGMAQAASRRPAPEWSAVEINGHLLVADPHSGAVHLLQPAAAAVWRDRDAWAKPVHAETVAALREAGLIPA